MHFYRFFNNTTVTFKQKILNGSFVVVIILKYWACAESVYRGLYRFFTFHVLENNLTIHIIEVSSILRICWIKGSGFCQILHRKHENVRLLLKIKSIFEYSPMLSISARHFPQNGNIQLLGNIKFYFKKVLSFAFLNFSSECLMHVFPLVQGFHPCDDPYSETFKKNVK